MKKVFLLVIAIAMFLGGIFGAEKATAQIGIRLQENLFIEREDGDAVSMFEGEIQFCIEEEEIEVAYDSVEFHGNFMISDNGELFISASEAVAFSFYKDGLVAFYHSKDGHQEIRFFSPGFDWNKTPDKFVKNGGTIISFFGEDWAIESPHNKVKLAGTDFYFEQKKYDYKKKKDKNKNVFVLEL